MENPITIIPRRTRTTSVALGDPFPGPKMAVTSVLVKHYVLPKRKVFIGYRRTSVLMTGDAALSTTTPPHPALFYNSSL